MIAGVYGTATWLATTLMFLLQDYHGDGSVAGFPGPGTWLIFAVILMPVYVMLIAWYAGRPRRIQTAVLGTVIFFGLIVGLWTAMLISTLIIGVVFY